MIVLRTDVDSTDEKPIDEEFVIGKKVGSISDPHVHKPSDHKLQISLSMFNCVSFRGKTYPDFTR
jgi:hypothetical protein